MAKSLLAPNGGLVTDTKSRYILYPWRLFSSFFPLSASELGRKSAPEGAIDGQEDPDGH